MTTAAGNVRYLADRDDAGHADRFWALALALHAGSSASGPADGMTVATGGRGGAEALQDRSRGYARPDNDDDFAPAAGARSEGW